MILLRADASADIGAGHVMRCLALAVALRARQRQVAFVCRRAPGDLVDWLERAHGLRVHVVDAHGDADATRTWAERSQASWIVVDHYGLDADWQERARPPGAKLLAVDDLGAAGERAHRCDFLLDTALDDDAEPRYRARVPPGCKLLLGPSFAMLRPAFAARRAELVPRSGVIRRVFVGFGGADPHDLASPAVAALLALGDRIPDADVVLGPVHRRADEIERRCAGTRVRVHRHVDDVALLMARADVAIGAGGVSSWERCCLGLPAIVVCMAENQRASVRALDAKRAIVPLELADCTTDRFVAELDALVAEPARVATMSRASWALTDGQGAARVADALSTEAAA